ncbi:ArsR family transcriptional regulator [Nonomuraea mesophila]|uniref:ArsR family transcriptional regulator n=1 Tax=Nonomuraea mesophila TaxID=2530382 RepID=A0A4R5F1R4_9ACTN|nr:helix-turn-helix domain-containing protein [Nonomuraea mesophila]TDE41394.1 ArsR family transcriptional regulator [Nonomuraea mesophila]
MPSGNSGSHSEPGTDPRALRALAHPVRLELLRLLELNGEVTASRAAELLGLAPKVCSYHLHLLAKYGVVEETGGGKGRARPWRLAMRRATYVHRPDEDSSATRSADAFAKTMLARDARTIETFIDRRHGLPDEWRNVSTLSSNLLWLTPDQLREFGRDMFAVLERYRRSGTSPAGGARPVQAILYAVPVGLPEG